MSACMFAVLAVRAIAGVDGPECLSNRQERTLALADGSVTTSCVDAKGVVDGPMWNRGADGRLRWVENHRQGRPHGLWVRFAPGGEILERRSYRNGVLHGIWEIFDSTGRQRLVGHFEDGVKSGPYEGWRLDGTRGFVGSFVAGKPDGSWRIFARKGLEAARCRYRRGQLEKKKIMSVKRELERAQVIERLAEVKLQVQYCFDRELELTSTLAHQGQVDAEFLVTPAGLTAAVELESELASSAPLQSCIADVIERLRFPELVTCELVALEFPFELRAR